MLDRYFITLGVPTTAGGLLELVDKVIEGTTDRKGWFQPLTAAQRAAVVAWRQPSAT